MSDTNPRPLAEMLEAYALKCATRNDGTLIDETSRDAFLAAVSLLMPCVEQLARECCCPGEDSWTTGKPIICDACERLNALRDKLESK